MQKNSRLIKSSIIVMVLLVIGKVLAFVRDALIAAKFGTTIETDIYMFAFGAVMLLTSIGYGLTTTFIPIHTENIEKKTFKERNEYVNKLLNVFMLFTIIVTVLGIIFAKYIIIICAPGFTKNPSVFSMAVQIIRIMFLSLIFVGMQSIITGVLQAHKYFFEPSAMSIASNLIYVVYLVLLPDKYGILGFGVATVLGFFSQYIINVPRFKALGYKYEFVLDFKDKDIIRLFKLMLPIIISTSLIQINLFINRSFATNLYEGAVSILDFSNKVTMLVYEVFAVAISTVVYPTLATHAANKNNAEYNKALGRSINMIFLILIPAAVGIIVLRIPIISVIFKRGQFVENSVIQTAEALLFFSPAIIFYGLRDILSRAFYSLKDTKTPMINSFFGILFNFILSFVLVKIMKVSGLTLAASISTGMITLLLFYNLNIKVKGINVKNIITEFIKILISSAVMGAVVYIIYKILGAHLASTMKGNLIIILISVIAALPVYIICAYILKIKELKEILNIGSHGDEN